MKTYLCVSGEEVLVFSESVVYVLSVNDPFWIAVWKLYPSFTKSLAWLNLTVKVSVWYEYCRKIWTFDPCMQENLLKVNKSQDNPKEFWELSSNFASTIKRI